MSNTAKKILDTVHNVLDQTIGKIPDFVQDPAGTIGDLSKIKPLKALGNFGEDIVHSAVDIGFGGIANDFGGGYTDEDLEKMKKLPLHEMMTNPNFMQDQYAQMMGLETFRGLAKEDINLFRKMGGQLAQEEKTRADVGELIPKERKVTRSNFMEKVYGPHTTRRYEEGSKKSQIEREMMGLARMYAGRQQDIRRGQRRPGQRESLLTRR